MWRLEPDVSQETLGRNGLSPQTALRREQKPRWRRSGWLDGCKSDPDPDPKSDPDPDPKPDPDPDPSQQCVMGQGPALHGAPEQLSRVWVETSSTERTFSLFTQCLIHRF